MPTISEKLTGKTHSDLTDNHLNFKLALPDSQLLYVIVTVKWQRGTGVRLDSRWSDDTTASFI
jgi:hypothetical protein